MDKKNFKIRLLLLPILYFMNLREPRELIVVGMLESKTKVSITHNEIRSWLKAVRSLGLRKINMARRLPKQPKVIRQDEVTPGTQYFHLTNA